MSAHKRGPFQFINYWPYNVGGGVGNVGFNVFRTGRGVMLSAFAGRWTLTIKAEREKK